MNNIGKNTLVAVAVGVVIFSAFAFKVVPTSESMSKGLEKKRTIENVIPAGEIRFALGDETYTKVEIDDLPQVVKSAVIIKYVAYSIDEVYRDHDDTYKVVLKNGLGKLITYYDASGEHLKQETVKPVQIVALD